MCRFRISLLIWVAAGLTGISSVGAAEPTPDTFDCIITPSQIVDLGSPQPGQLHEVLVDRSDRVKQGQVVARLDSRLERANLAIAGFRAESDTELRLREAALTIDERTEKRLFSLAASKVASAQERDRASREAVLSLWRMRQAQDDLRLYDLELARAQAALDRRVISSPIDGVVVERMSSPGEYIDEKPLMRIVKLDPLYVEAILPMRLFGTVSAGMQARVLPELEGTGKHEAQVMLVDPMGDAASGTFGVRLAMSNPDESIPAGLKCRVQLSGATPVLSERQGADGEKARIAALRQPAQ